MHLFCSTLKIILQYAGSRFVEHDCPNSENRVKCLANQLFEETPECGGVKIEGDLIYFENAFGRGGDCAPIIADDFRIRVRNQLNRYISMSDLIFIFCLQCV